MSKTSVVIVTFNSAKTIKSCLFSVDELKDVEVIVVDNDSSENTIEEIKKFQKVKLIENRENLGFGKANNLGVKNSNGENIFFLNPDCVVEKDTVKILTDFLADNKDVAVVGPKLLNSDGSLQKEISPFPTFLSEIMVLLRLHRLTFFQKLVYPNYDYSKIQEAEHLIGAALLVRKNIFEDLGGFDENFFLWFEETDLLKRIKKSGYKVVYFPGTSVTHSLGQSTRRVNFLKKQTIWDKSLIYYFRKHKGWVKLLALLPFIVLSYPAALVSVLIKR